MPFPVLVTPVAQSLHSEWKAETASSSFDLPFIPLMWLTLTPHPVHCHGWVAEGTMQSRGSPV